MELTLLPDSLAICRLPPTTPIPGWAEAGALFAIVRTPDALTVVCPDGHPPAEVQCDAGWRALEVGGPLPLAEVGVLAGLSAPLAQAGICLFVISSFDTDYLLVKEGDLSGAIRALSSEHTIHAGSAN